MARVLSILFLVAVASGWTLAQPARAQTPDQAPSEFDTGVENFPIHVYLNIVGSGGPLANLFCGQGLSGGLFRDRPDGGPGWFQTLESEGIGALAFDWPGTGKAPAPINRDLIRALNAHVSAAFDLGRGSLPLLCFAHAEGAALLIKNRSFGDYTSRTAVLIDPIGPQYSQPLEPITFDEALARKATFEDDLWRQYGFGPRVGELYDGLDVDLETATAVFESYQRDCFPIRPALLQPLISPIRVEGTSHIAGWYVLMVRTPAADPQQIEREEALTAWLREAGATVESLDLSADPAFAGVTGLPWIGEQAPAVMERFIEWYRRVILLAPESRDLPRQGSRSR